MNKFIFALLMLGFMACSSGPQEINYGSDKCDFCSMGIADKPFGTELVSDKGKAYKFDSTECMLNYLGKNEDKTFTHYLTATMDQPGTLQDARQAYYLVSENLPSPMGANISAYTTKALAEASQSENGGEVYDFEGIKEVQSKQHQPLH